MSRTRVAIVVPKLGLSSEVWILRQCAGFRQIEPVIVCWENLLPSDGGLEVHYVGAPFEERSLLRRALAKLGLGAGAMPSRRLQAAVRRAIDEAKVQAVLCHFAWTGLVVTNSLPADLPTVWHVHGRDVSRNLRFPAYRRAVARTLGRVRHLVAVGRFQLDILKALAPLPPHSLIPCGAPLDLFRRAPAPLREAGRPLRLIGVSRMTDEKGVMQTLEAFEGACQQRSDLELVFVGDGPKLPDLRAAVERSAHREKITLTGPLPPEAVADELARSHVFVQHSREVGGWIEGFGVSLTEAAAAGLPLLTTETGGIVDQVEHEQNGLLFRPDDVARQTEYILRLAGDEDLRRRLGARAREMAERFDSALMIAKLERVLLDVVGATGASAPASDAAQDVKLAAPAAG